MADESKVYRIEEFTAENFKRLKVVSIRPDGDVVQITGRNGSGKTSVLDGILGLFAGGRSLPMKPIREGCESAILKADLGDLKVTRKFRTSETDKRGWTTDLIVETVSGGRMQHPQAVVEALVGEFSFDPLAFTRLKDDEQFEALKAFVPGFNFDQSSALDRADFAKRTDHNREAKSLRAQADGVSVPPGPVPALVDVEALEAQLAKASGHNEDIARRSAARETAQARIATIASEIAALQAEANDLQKRLDEAGPLPDRIDVTDVQERLATGRASNEARAKHERKADLLKRAEAEEAASKALTKAMADREDERQKAIRSAKMPVPGLGFHPDGYITLEGQPFSQASDAQQLRASIAIAAAKNPRLRVARVRDGSLLDDVAMADLHKFAAEAGIQIWIEVVTSGGPVGFVMSEGELSDGSSPSDDENGEAI